MARFTKKLRQRILDGYRSRHGGHYDPAGFVAEASDPDHEAHEWFVWDDDKAAHEYRLWQARVFTHDLKVGFSVEIISRGGIVRVSEEEAPAFISPLNSRRGGGGYMAVDPSDKETMAALCDEAAMSLRAWLRRYSGVLTWASGSPAVLERQVGLLTAVAPVKEESEAA